MTRPALVVLAAGMGSRYGGLKQIDPIGPNGELIIDFSVYDAIKAGFDKVVFVIKEENYDVFHDSIGKRISKLIDVKYVFQKLENVPAGIQIPDDRIKPWGTGHAVMCCKDVVNTPFVVINSDDFYGASTYKTLYNFLTDKNDDNEYCLAGFRLENTLTENGGVSRGICSVDTSGYLTHIKECSDIQRTDNAIQCSEDNITYTTLAKDSITSMNIWGLTPTVFQKLETLFKDFVKQNSGNLSKSEFYLPSSVDQMIASGNTKVKVLSSKEQWYGVTYKADKKYIKACLWQLMDKGLYPNTLWN